MKQNFKLILVSGILSWGLLVPSFGLAQETYLSDKQLNLSTQDPNTFCSRIDNIAEKLNQRVLDRVEKISSRRVKQVDNFQQRRLNRDNRRQENRLSTDSIRAEKYLQLFEKSDTEDRKITVETFKQRVETAVTERRTAIDSAIASFRSDLDQALINRQTAIDKVVETFQSAILESTNQAQADCRSGMNKKLVRINMRQELKQARDQLITERTQIDQISDKINQLSEVKQDVFEQTWINFQIVFENAHQELKCL